VVLEAFGVPLEHLDGRRFTAFGLDFEFLGPMGQPATGLRATMGDQLFDSVTRVAPFTPTSAQLARFAGRFYSDELDVVYTLTATDSTLVLTRLKQERPEVLRPAYQDGFIGAAGAIRFEMVKGRPDLFFLTGGRVRGVEFRRGDPRPPRR